MSIMYININEINYSTISPRHVSRNAFVSQCDIKACFNATLFQFVDAQVVIKQLQVMLRMAVKTTSPICCR